MNTQQPQNRTETQSLGFSKLPERTAGLALHSSNHVGNQNPGFAWR